ncbi:MULTISPECIES: hypothetical protein [unclassified Streptomyces]|uniref:hypothetical protein n=1 Tax=unclassified Streptomyces TaxID=2593676 RepID=UPI003421F0F1
MSDSRAVDGAQPPALSPFFAAGLQDGEVVAIDRARLARSRALPCPSLRSPTLASAESAGILQSPPDIGALIRRLRA